jgi:hypothetical protein
VPAPDVFPAADGQFGHEEEEEREETFQALEPGRLLVLARERLEEDERAHAHALGTAPHQVEHHGNEEEQPPGDEAGVHELSFTSVVGAMSVRSFWVQILLSR